MFLYRYSQFKISQWQETSLVTLHDRTYGRAGDTILEVHHTTFYLIHGHCFCSGIHISQFPKSRFGVLTKRIVDKLTMKTGSKFGHLMKLNCDKRLHLVSRFLYSDIPGMTNATKNIPFSRVLYYGGGPPALGDLPLPHWIHDIVYRVDSIEKTIQQSGELVSQFARLLLRRS